MRKIDNQIDNEKEKTIKATFYYFVSNITVNIISFLGIIVFARLMTQAEYGLYNNFLAWRSVFVIIFTLSTSSTLVKARFDFRDDLYSYMGTNILLSMLSTVFFFALFAINRALFVRITSIDFAYFAIMSISILFLPAYEMCQQMMRFSYQYKKLVLLQITTAVSDVLLSLLMIYGTKNGYMSRVIGSQVPLIVCSACMFAFILRRMGRVRVEYCRYSGRIIPGYMMHLLAGIVLYSSDRVIINYFCGAEDTALYSMACNIAILANAVWEALNSAYAPWMGARLAEKDYGAVRDYSYAYVLFYAVFIAGLMLVAPEALRFLGGGAYQSAKYVVPPIMLSYYFLFVYSMYVNIEQFENKTGYMAFATVVAAASNGILNVIYIPRYGYMAAALTTLVGYGFLVIFHIVVIRRLGYQEIYNMWYLMAVTACLCTFSVGCIYVYRHDVFRYGMLFLYAALCLILFMRYRTRIMQMFMRERKGEK